MSRIGKMPINFSDKVMVTIEDNYILVKGPLGELGFNYSSNIDVSKDDNLILVKCLSKDANALWGTTRSVINNMVLGVVTAYKKSLEINGVGYKFEVQGTKLILSIGFSHKVEMNIPTGLKVEIDSKIKNILHISGIDKQLVGEFAAKVKSRKKPEPYKGKGIKYLGEYIRRKAGKTGSK